MLDKQSLIELKELLKKDFGQELSDEEVFDVAQTLLGTFEILAKQDYENRNKKN